MDLLMNGAPLMFLIFYSPFLLALYVLISHHKQISIVWTIILLGSLLTGAAPFVALIFLASQRKMLQHPEVESSVQHSPTSSTVSASPEGTTGTMGLGRKSGTALGTLVGAVLWISGLAVVGFFVIVTLAVIQCSNDPKCM